MQRGKNKVKKGSLEVNFGLLWEEGKCYLWRGWGGGGGLIWLSLTADKSIHNASKKTRAKYVN